MKSQHKPILFDEILAPQKQEVAIKKMKTYNRFKYVFSVILKWFFIIVISIIGSLLLSALLTAILQERPFLSVVEEFVNKFTAFLK